MDYQAKVDFIGVVGGKEVMFAPGDKITAAQAKELGLDRKPELAGKVKNA